MASEEATPKAMDVKKAFNSSTIKYKSEMLDRLAKNDAASLTLLESGVTPSTAKNTTRPDNVMRKSVSPNMNFSEKKSTRRLHHDKMEKELITWIKDSSAQSVNVTGKMIRSKALEIFEKIHLENPGYRHLTGKFMASHAWLTLFRQRHKIILNDDVGSVDVSEDLKMVSDEVDEPLKSTSILNEFDSLHYVDEFRSALLRVVESEGYRPEQVFNVAETSLYWKRLPDRTFISQEEKMLPGFKASNDKISLLFCANAVGNFRLKPLLVYRTENPVALSGTLKTHLPVIWRSNSKVQVTASIVEEWVTSYAIPAITEYNREMDFENKALIAVDSSPNHTALLNQLHPTIKFLFLPPEATQIIQPLDQGVLAQFKRLYTKAVLEKLVASLNAWRINLMSIWQSFNIKEAIGLIHRCWKGMHVKTINAGWSNVWPDIVSSDSCFPRIKDEIDVLLEIGRKIPGMGFEKLTDNELCYFLESHQEELSDEEMIEVNEATIEEEFVADQGKESILPLTASEIGGFLGKCTDILHLLEKRDPHLERSSNVIDNIERSLLPYRDLYDKLVREQQQSNIQKFFSPLPPHQDHFSLSSSSSSPGIKGSSESPECERRYPCSYCNKRFKLKTTLDQHILVHYNDRRYSCNQCNARFNRKDHLQRHRLVHLKGGEQAKCKLCINGSPCKVHESANRYFHKKRRYRCRLCTESFPRLVSLREHMSHHNGAKVYACSICNETFNFKILLNQHLAEHGDEGQIANHSMETDSSFQELENAERDLQEFETSKEEIPGDKYPFEGFVKGQMLSVNGHIPQIKVENIKQEIEDGDLEEWSVSVAGSENQGYLPDQFFPQCNIEIDVQDTKKISIPSVMQHSILSADSKTCADVKNIPGSVFRPVTSVSPASSSGSVHLEDTTTRSGRKTRKPLRFRKIDGGSSDSDE